MLLVATLLPGAVATAAAQPALLPAEDDTTSSVTMHALLEKTIFKVDVLTLTVRIFGDRAEWIRQLVAMRSGANEVADSVAQLAIHARAATAEIEFKRGVSFNQFVNGIDDNLRKARDAGIIARNDYDLIAAGLPRWFGFLERDGIEKGDRITYEIRGDTLTTRYWTVNGDLRLDQTDVGPERRLAVLGSYFVRKSDFRNDLVGSLFGPQ